MRRAQCCSKPRGDLFLPRDPPFGNCTIENQVARNFHACPQFSEDSFVSRLHEQGVWNEQEFQALLSALGELTPDGRQCEQLTWRVFRIFSFLSGAFIAHLDPNDGFSISELAPEALLDRRLLVQAAFESFFQPSVSAER